MCKFRALTADEIEVRVGQASEKGVSLLLYKDARVDMNILDETVGALNWQREHYECKGNLFCRVGINRNWGDPSKAPEWVWKSDCGTESNTEAEKGEASDSFKRACTNLGIGRELYTAPFIWVSKDNCNIVPKGQKYACYDNFSVKSVEIVEGKIVALEIENTRSHAVVYTFGKRPAPATTGATITAKVTELATQADELAQKREWASKYVIPDGEQRGHLLTWLYKKNRAAFIQLKAAPINQECADAIAIIEAWAAEGK